MNILSNVYTKFKNLPMKIKVLIFCLAVSVITLFAAFQTNEAYEEREGIILDGVLNVVQNMHVNPKPIDDSFSQEVFDRYLERIDGGKRFLIQSEVDMLSMHKDDIDNQVKRRTFEFFDTSVVVLDAALNRTKEIYEELKEEKLSYDEDIVFQLDGKKRSYASDRDGLKDFWRSSLKYDVLNRLRRAEKGEKERLDSLAEGVEKKIKTREELLEKAEKEAKKSVDRWFERLDKLRRSDRFEAYLGAITNYFDPHTDYFNPKEKEDFDINMGGKLEGIGARLSSDGEVTKVASIIPGGPAWKGKELQNKDVILAAREEDAETAVDLTGMRLDDVVQHIRGKKGTVVVLTIQKTDGTVKDITIERDEVIIDESFARSLIIGKDDVIGNIGYIYLPKFYSSFEREGGNSCAADVAYEITKLKDNKVGGIILDLRNNTGGSLKDVVDMTGLFIKEGPIVQVKSRNKKPYIYDDPSGDVLYDGPIIVMVNEMSASASEILAAALQDYGRAVIVGSEYTFGKGSVQRFLDLDRVYTGNDDIKPLGNLKISLQKFYRVNGGSTQKKGVISDIILPDNYMYVKTGEKEYENALAWSEIDPLEYSQDVLKVSNLEALKANSNKRVSSSEEFNLIKKSAQIIKDNRDKSEISLSMDKYNTLMDAKEAESKEFEHLFKDPVEGLSANNMEIDLKYINDDESRVARNEDWVKGVKKDFYIEEVLYIMKDMIDADPSLSLTKKVK